jgi:hypothetical protein
MVKEKIIVLTLIQLGDVTFDMANWGKMLRNLKICQAITQITAV